MFQRKGRAGRVQAGLAFHMYSERIANKLADFQVPELLRTPLEELCLQVKVKPSVQFSFIFQSLTRCPVAVSGARAGRHKQILSQSAGPAQQASGQ